MAVTTGTIFSVNTIKSDTVSDLQLAEVLFTMSGTYAQADASKLEDVGAAISAARKNGKTVTLVGAMVGTPATKATDVTKIMAIKTVAVSSDDLTFKITNESFSTELGDATAIPAQHRPFSTVVAFTEA